MRELTEEELARADPPRPQPDRRPRPEHRRADRDAAGAQAQDPRNLRNAHASARRPHKRSIAGGRSQAAARNSAKRSTRPCQDEQIRELERLWYAAGDDQSPFARQPGAARSNGSATSTRSTSWPPSTSSPAAKSLTVPQALEIKEELEKIDELLKQLEEAAQDGPDRHHRHGSCSPSSPSRATSSSSAQLQQQIQDYLRELAEQQGLEQQPRRLPAHAQGVPAVSRQAARAASSANCSPRAPAGTRARSSAKGRSSCKHTKQYEFGDSVANMDIPGIVHQRDDPRRPGHAGALQPGRHRRSTARATRPSAPPCVLMDMSGSMRYDGQYINVKRMAPGARRPDPPRVPRRLLQFIEMYTFAKPRRAGRDRRTDAQAGDDLRPGRAAAGRHEPRRRQRASHPAALHEHPARPAAGPPAARRRRTRRTGRSS